MGVAASLLWMVLNQALIWQFFDSGSTSVLSSFALLVGLPFIYQFITSRPEDYNSNFLIIRPLFLLCFCFPLFEYIGLYLPRPQNIALLNLLVLLAMAVEILKEYIFKDGARKLSFSAFLLTLCFYSLYSLEIVDSGRYYSLAILLFSMKLSLFQSKNRIKSVFRLLDYLIVFVIILAAYSKEGGFHLGELSFIFAVLVALLSLGQYADQVENKLVRMGSKLMYLKLGAGIVSVGFILGGSLWN